MSGKRLGVVISFSGDGGVERMVLNLCAEFARHVTVDLLPIKLSGGHAERVPPGVNLRPLKAKHAWTSIPEIAAYLREAQPDALLVAKDRAGRGALRAQRRARSKSPVFVRLGTNLSAALERKDAFSRWLRVQPMRSAYARAAGVIAVSEGVRQDTLRLTGLPSGRVHVIRNPVITGRLDGQAAAPSPHAWLGDGGSPVIVGMGRLTRQKDFSTLLRAFARMLAQRNARLVILGEGGEREALMQLAGELGIASHLLMPGFQSNPYAWISRAQLFVLSSAWEGSPNALTEALALGIPSVSTDCPSGPSEILDRGRYGPLVPVGDFEALAQAMAATLANPLPAETLRAAVDEYRAPLSALRYLQLMGLASDKA